MSNVIRYDPLLVRYLAAELNHRLAGRSVRAVRLDAEARTAALETDGATLRFDLHPERGWIRLAPPPPIPERVPVHRRAEVGAVSAPDDERILIVDIASPGRSVRQARRIVVELMTNQWNLLVLNREGRILDALWRRAAGDRSLRPGAEYTLPPARPRTTDPTPEAWRDAVGTVPPEERARALVRAMAYTSPLNAAAILGEAATTSSEAAVDTAWRRYRELTGFPPAQPCLLELEHGRQPYPLPLAGVQATPFPTLLDAMAAVAGEAAEEEPVAAAPAVAAELLGTLRKRIEQARSRRDRLAQELEGAAPEAEALRRKADLLLSQLHTVQKGMERVELSDFAGGTVDVELDPALSPADNANRLYEAAQKRERAAQRLPRLIQEAEAREETLASLLTRAERGEATEEEVREAVGPLPGEEADKRREPETLPPYRRYRTSGGLEVRVGRNRRANDELTFHHSSPDDIWLHARDVAGSHVILRWPRADANPPAQDLLEAAVLAALHSRARTAGAVPVDWTRRKYVRKPRKSPPGLVVPDRVKTLFVEPDARLEDRLRERS